MMEQVIQWSNQNNPNHWDVFQPGSRWYDAVCRIGAGNNLPGNFRDRLLFTSCWRVLVYRQSGKKVKDNGSYIFVSGNFRRPVQFSGSI